jgi:hypothetical protein
LLFGKVVLIDTKLVDLERQDLRVTLDVLEHCLEAFRDLKVCITDHDAMAAVL